MTCIISALRVTLTLRKETSVLEYLNMLISLSGCTDLIRYYEMFLHFNKQEV